jgi:hypothetical protein
LELRSRWCMAVARYAHTLSLHNSPKVLPRANHHRRERATDGRGRAIHSWPCRVSVSSSRFLPFSLL